MVGQAGGRREAAEIENIRGIAVFEINRPTSGVLVYVNGFYDSW